jgi:PBSX family phage terminase large subunit
MTKFVPTDKGLDLTTLALKPSVNLIVAEGTIRSSKTEFFKIAFMYSVFDNVEELHLIAANDLDAINDNILAGEHGILNMFPNHTSIRRDEIGGYYLHVKGCVPMNNPKDKKVLLAGFSSANKWKKILGKTLGVIFIDEVNTANKQFVDECFARQASVKNPLQLWTLNGDVPTHWIYTDYINRCHIFKKYRWEVPASIVADMDKIEKQKGWYYIHFNFNNNPAMGEAEIERTKSIYPVGSYYHTIKILGERGAPGLLLFNDYMSPDKHIKPIDTRKYVEYGIGADIGGNKAFNSFSLVGFNHDYSKCGVVDKKTFQQCGYNQKTEELITFIKSHYDKPIRYVAIDSAESNFIKDIRTLFKSIFPHIAVIESYKSTIKQRCDLMIILLSHEQIEFNNTKEGIDTYDAYRIAKKSEKPNEYREDKNERHNDIMDSTEYALTRHMNALLKASKDYERFREVA